MCNLILNPTALAQWHTLFTEAQAYCSSRIEEEIESYVIFMLMRHVNDAQLANHVLAVDYLAAAQDSHHSKFNRLRDVGDNCLLVAGLFPQRADKKLVRISYFVNLGQGAYHMLADSGEQALAALFQHLAEQFVQLMDILQAMRCVIHDIPTLTPLQAAELWSDTRSQQALSQLKQYTHNIPTGFSEEHKPTAH